MNVTLLDKQQMSVQDYSKCTIMRMLSSSRYLFLK